MEINMKKITGVLMIVALPLLLNACASSMNHDMMNDDSMLHEEKMMDDGMMKKDGIKSDKMMKKDDMM
jgi:major membrane immunogen (membrane-anchored lipoprotein)